MKEVLLYNINGKFWHLDISGYGWLRKKRLRKKECVVARLLIKII
jgi:hypothetical protein